MEEKKAIIKEIIKLEVEEFLQNQNQRKLEFSNLAYHFIEEAIEALGYSDNDDLDTNGWQVDYWNTFSNGDNHLSVSGSMYYGDMTIYKGKQW